MDTKILVKLFIYKGRFFVYTPYSNNILCITKEQYKELQRLAKLDLNEYLSENNYTQEYRDIVMLIKSGLITQHFIEDIKHPATDDYPLIVNRGMQRLILQVTQRCNFSCRYCHNIYSKSARFVSERSDMNWNVAKQSVDYFINHSQDSESVDIYFYGGEPLLNFTLIKKVVEYLELRINTKSVIYHITTNGSLLTEEIAIFLAKYKFKVAISIDGNNERQNWARKFADGGYTYDIVWDKIQMLQTLYGEHNNIMFLPVVFADEDRKKVVYFFESNGIEQNRIILLEANVSGIDYAHSLIQKEPSKEKVINASLVDFDNIDEDKFNDFVKKYDNKHNIGKIWHHAGTCIPGYFKLFVNTKGFFYPCENASECPDMCIGNVIDGINIENAITVLNVGQITKEDCKNCWALRFCSMCALYCVDAEKCTMSLEIKRLNCVGLQKHTLNLLKKYIDTLYFNQENCNNGQN